MKIGVSVNTKVCRTELESYLRRVKRMGFDCVDMQFFADTENGWFDGTAAELESRCAEARRIAADCGLEISQTHGPWRYPPQDDTPEDRAERFDKFARSVEGTAAMGSPCMVIHCIMPFGPRHPAKPDDPDAARFLELNRDFYTRLLERAKACGVVLALENLPFTSLMLSSAQEVVDFVREFDTPYFRVCLDTGHAAVLKTGAGDAVRLIGKEYLAALHVHDNDGKGDLHWVPFAGVTDWADFSRALHEIGFDGTVSLETHVRSMASHLPDALWDLYGQALAQTARFLTEKPADTAPKA